MSKQRTVQVITDSGNNYGQIINPNDLVKSQEYSHLHAENITRDFLTLFFETDVAQFGVEPVGLSVNVAAGRIYQNGFQFDADAVQLTFETPHNTHPRIDVIYATVTQDSPEQQTLTPFQRIRTQLELTNGAAPYPPVQYNVPLEKNNKVTLGIKKGVAAASPVAPTLAAGEIPLYNVTIAANAISLNVGNFSDQRRLAANLRQMRNEINGMINTLTTFQNAITALQAYRYDLVNVNWDSSFGGTRQIHSVMEEIGSKVQVLRYRYPSMLTGDGRIQAVGNLDGLIPVIDIPIGTLVQFGDRFVTIQANAFTDASLNARQITSGINNTNSLFEGMDEQFNLSNAQNTIRLNAPSTTEYLYLNRDGSLYFKKDCTGSNANECLLLESKPNSGAPPTLLNYINLRQAVIIKSGTASGSASSKQFVNDIGIPPGIGYTRAYAVKASDKSIYEVTLSGISGINDVVDVIGVTTGDKWVVEMNIFSIY